MRNINKKFLLIVLVMSVALLPSAGLIADDNGDLTTQILAVAGKEGGPYLEGRKALEATYRARTKEFNDVIKTTDDWRVKIMGEIVRERVTKAKAIAKFVETAMDYPDTRAWDMKIIGVGDDMTSKGKDVPMLLVEKIWKNNELNNYPLGEGSGCAAVTCAISKLGIRDARPILENVVSNDVYFVNRPEIAKSRTRPEVAINEVRGYAAVTLGEFGDPRSVPALVNLMEKAFVAKSSDAGRAGFGIVQCMNESSVPFMEKIIAETKNQRLKEFLTKTIQDFKAKKSAKKQ